MLENYHINRCNRAKSVRFFSKKAALELFEYSPTFRTLIFPDGNYPPARIPQEILEDEKLAIAFLRAFASCDGGVVVNRAEGQYRVEIACRHPVLQKQLLQLLEKTGFEGVSTPERIMVRSKENLKKFLEKIGFLPESTVCKGSIYYGLPKVAVLWSSEDSQPNHPPAAVLRLKGTMRNAVNE